MWLQNKHDDYIFINGKFGFFKKLWFLLKGYRKSDRSIKIDTKILEETEEIYRYLKRKHPGV
jgi:hypothetical protein